MAAVVSEDSCDESSLSTRKKDDPLPMREDSVDSPIPADAKNLLLDQPMDPLLHVFSYLEPDVIERLRYVNRPLKEFVDEKRNSLPKFDAFIALYDNKKTGDVTIKVCIDISNRDMITLPYTKISELVAALVEPIGLVPSLLSRILGPSCHLSRLIFHGFGEHLDFASVRTLDADIAALNDVVPPFTVFLLNKMSLHDITYDTMKAVVARRELRILRCSLPKWDEEEEPRPVSSNLIAVQIPCRENINEDNRYFVRAVLALSTRVRFSYYPTSRAGKDEGRDLMECLARTAVFLDLRYDALDDAGLVHLASISRIECGVAWDKNLSTTGIRNLIKGYIALGREASAEIRIVGRDQAAFFPLRAGLFINSIASEAEQRGRTDTCVDGDVFLFTSRHMSVRVRCSAPKYSDGEPATYFTFYVDASVFYGW